MISHWTTSPWSGEEGKNLNFFGFLEYKTNLRELHVIDVTTTWLNDWFSEHCENEIHLVLRRKTQKPNMRQDLIWNEDYGGEE